MHTKQLIGGDDIFTRLELLVSSVRAHSVAVVTPNWYNLHKYLPSHGDYFIYSGFSQSAQNSFFLLTIKVHCTYFGHPLASDITVLNDV